MKSWKAGATVGSICGVGMHGVLRIAGVAAAWGMSEAAGLRPGNDTSTDSTWAAATIGLFFAAFVQYAADSYKRWNNASLKADISSRYQHYNENSGAANSMFGFGSGFFDGFVEPAASMNVVLCGIPAAVDRGPYVEFDAVVLV